MQLYYSKRWYLFMCLTLFCIILQQFQIFNHTLKFFFSGSSPLNQPDSVSIYERKLASVGSLLPPKSTVGYIQDNGLSLYQGHIFLSQYAVVPHLLQEKPLPDTVLANFPVSGTLQHPGNPLYAERKDWIVLKNFKNGFLLLTKK